MQDLPVITRPPQLLAPEQPRRLPPWIRAKFPGGPNYIRLQGLLRSR
ncbi:MAG: hypothetical protein HYY02_13025 [Chloroflexi bacterium]|nr:hypothetical protein [Chloroflexota bacterium]